jgi:uncharacterized membrane protein YkvA (DUF1232 family)
MPIGGERIRDRVQALAEVDSHTRDVDWGPVIAVLVGLLAAWALFIALLWIMRPRDSRLRDALALLPDLVRLVRGLLTDPASPRGVRVALALLLVWLISPIDLIPEFIPVLGPVDDVVVAILVLRYVRRRLGTEALRERWPGSEAGFELLLGVVGRG